MAWHVGLRRPRGGSVFCTDEQVVYDIVETAGKPNTVTVKADKIVNGNRVPMAVFDFTHDARTDSWWTEFESPRVHARWELAVTGTRMTGRMTLLPSGAVVRRMDLRRTA